MRNEHFLTGPIVIEPRPHPDGSIRYEVWDNGAFSFHRIETVDSKVKAEALVKKLTAAIASRDIRRWS